MPYYNNFWHIDAYENIPSPACLIVFVTLKNWEPAYQIYYCVFAYLVAENNVKREAVANLLLHETADFITSDLWPPITVLTLILCITGYVE